MAGMTDFNLDIAWKALRSQPDDVEWAMIPITQPGIFTAHAARKFPGDLEALTIDFPGTSISVSRRLPEGGGFEVVRPNASTTGSPVSAVALVRHPAGALEMFKVMATDILTLLDRNRDLTSSVLINRFLERIEAWQVFMQPPRDGPLDIEAQTGLFGELKFLGTLLDHNTPGQLAVDAWDGPLQGAQDYRINGAGVEVKSTTTTEGFVAKIQSLEQLDDGEASPLFLVALRLNESSGGCTLPELVGVLRRRLHTDGSRSMFDRKLLAVGYHDDHLENYDRCLTVTETRMYRVDASFPRLFRGNIANAIRRACYEIDIDSFDATQVSEAALFQGIGLE
jgi:hypothetical protein